MEKWHKSKLKDSRYAPKYWGDQSIDTPYGFCHRVENSDVRIFSCHPMRSGNRKWLVEISLRRGSTFASGHKIIAEKSPHLLGSKVMEINNCYCDECRNFAIQYMFENEGFLPGYYPFNWKDKWVSP